MKSINKIPLVIAFYLPQYHPIPENDKWWGKGFTEWTNVGRATSLYWGHYQPKVPADLGYYDLRVPETREAQADMAKEHGINGFCYWHYWFGNGKRLLERPFNEVLQSGKPDFPFCLAWANHSWKEKTWSPDGDEVLLIKQTYPGKEDYTKHFYTLLPAFKDHRYLKITNRPFFLIWDPDDIPDLPLFIDNWNNLANANGFDGFYFVAKAYNIKDANRYISEGFDSVSLDLCNQAFFNRNIFKKLQFRFLRAMFKIPTYMDYNEYSKYFLNNIPINKNIIPTIIPNFDQSPRFGKYALIFFNSTPKKFAKLLRSLFNKIIKYHAETNIIIIRSWNEWAEGNYLEPDLKYGKGNLKALHNELTHFEKKIIPK